MSKQPTLGASAKIALAVSFALTCAAAQAQTDGEKESESSDALPEITVTAERYGGTVQTTPVAITAVNTEQLAERQITNVLQAASEVPGIVITPSTGSSVNARIVLRGAGQEQGGINFDPAVGIYIDDVYQPRINGAFFDFFDIERLEVLRGPQGTLYGRNTSGGAMKIETTRPAFDWTTSLQLAAGNWEAREGKAYISGPLIADKLAFSVSGVKRERDGYLWGRAYDRRVGDMDRTAERLKLLYTPSGNFEVQFAAYAMQDYSDPGVGVPLSVPATVVDPFAVPGRDLTSTELSGPLFQRLNNSGASLRASYTASDALKVNAITGYGNLRIISSGNTLWFGVPPGNDGLLKDEFYSQELNATYTNERIKGVVGLFYFDETGMNRSIAAGSSAIDQDRKTEASAVFGQVTYNFGNGFGVTVGDRYTREVADFTQFYRLLTNLSPVPQSAKKTFTGTSPKVGLNWQVNPDLLTYVAWTKGFKSGGFNPIPPNANTGVPGAIGQPTPYDEETVDSYELGAKYTTPGGKFRLNAALYDSEYEGLQLPVFFPGTSTSYTSNATGATIRGIELEPTWQVIEGLQLFGNASFTHGEYTDSFICSGADTVFRDCQDKKIKGLVPSRIVAGFRYAPRLPIPGQIGITATWLYNDKYYNNVSNEGPLVQTQAVDIYNGGVNWTNEDGRYSISLEGRNLANKHYVLAGLQLASATQPAVTGYINDPRQFMLRANVSF